MILVCFMVLLVLIMKGLLFFYGDLAPLSEWLVHCWILFGVEIQQTSVDYVQIMLRNVIVLTLLNDLIRFE